MGTNIHRIAIRLDRVGDEQYVLLQSDVHWDNPMCDRETWLRHLDEARDRDAPILDCGDFFCAMQGRWDKRANKADLRPEHQVGDYLDALVRTGAEALLPYADLLTVRGEGNHEVSIAERHETQIGDRLVERIKTLAPKSPIVKGGYHGFVIFDIAWQKTRQRPFKLYYHHGSGGGGPVTKGVIQTNRQAAYLSDADLVWNGHTHDQWHVPQARVRLNQKASDIEHTRQDYIRTAGYKQEWTLKNRGFHIKRWGPPKPIGAAWLRFTYPKYDMVEYHVIEAK